MGMGISAVVLTRNNINTISKCLKSLQWVDELIVVDSFSEDGTQEIINRHADTVLQKAKPGDGKPYDHYRRDGFTEAKYEWIVNIDADEWMTEALAQKLRQIASKNKADVISGPKKNFVGNKWVDAGFWWPDYTILMLRRQCVSISPEIHDFYNVDPKACRVKLPEDEEFALRHLLFDSYIHAFQVNHRYAKIRGNQEQFTLPKLAAFPYTFWKIYVKNSSYRAGIPGLVLSISHAFYRTEAAYRALYRRIMNT